MKLYECYKVITLFLYISIFTSCHKNYKTSTENLLTWKQVSVWSIKGQMAINDGQNSGTGRLIWDVNHGLTKAKFRAPLGQGSWTITESTNQAQLLSSKTGETIAENAEILISNKLGWTFPWNSLKFWLRGYPSNQLLKPHLELPVTINDNGWTVTYQKWMETPLGLLPKKIKATKDNYSVSLFISNWNIKSL